MRPSLFKFNHLDLLVDLKNMQIDLIAGTRPNFVKISALIHAIHENENEITYRLIHTGQHYDKNLSASFFKDLNIPNPSINLGVGSGSQATQTANIMIAYEESLKSYKPDLCIVVGDVTSSMACAITAKKLNVKVGHIEAGIRSNDWTMPEEVNRVLIDSISNYFFTTTRNASNLLLDNGHPKDKIVFVGNTMIDTLLRFQHKFSKPEIWNRLKLKPKNYIVLTLHRPSNVDSLEKIQIFLKEICSNSKNLPIIFPVHPRTKEILLDSAVNLPNLYFTDALGYLEFNFLVKNSLAVITDSGGITEETTVLGVPCITIRANTERPETIEIGTNELIGTDPVKIKPILQKLFNDQWKKGGIPELWDGKTSQRIINFLIKEFN